MLNSMLVAVCAKAIEPYFVRVCYRGRRGGVERFHNPAFLCSDGSNEVRLQRYVSLHLILWARCWWLGADEVRAV